MAIGQSREPAGRAGTGAMCTAAIPFWVWESSWGSSYAATVMAAAGRPIGSDSPAPVPRAPAPDLRRGRGPRSRAARKIAPASASIGVGAGRRRRGGRGAARTAGGGPARAASPCAPSTPTRPAGAKDDSRDARVLRTDPDRLLAMACALLASRTLFDSARGDAAASWRHFSGRWLGTSLSAPPRAPLVGRPSPRSPS